MCETINNVTAKLTDNLGEIHDGTHFYPVRVFYEDTDFTGVVYHAKYLHFTERARSCLLELVECGQSYLLAQTPALCFVVRSLTIDYKSPGRINDSLVVRTRGLGTRGRPIALIPLTQTAKKTPNISVRFWLSQDVYCRDVLLCSTRIELACIDMQTRPRRLPTQMVARLLPFFTPP